MPQLTLRYWAAARSAAGTDEEAFDAASVGEALDQARRRHPDPAFAELLARCSLLCDGRRLHPEDLAAPLAGEALVEALPPFAGG